MNSGFTQEHFDLLAAHAGRPAPDGTYGPVFTALRTAHYATKDWAKELKDVLFPDGRIKARRAPINQGGNITPYTWAKIYPYPDAPEALAYTVGIDTDQTFIVKMDTVDAGPELRAKYEAVRGLTNDGASIAEAMDAAEGLKMSREELVSWSVHAIRGFKPGYDELVRILKLEPPLRLITDLEEARRAGLDWRRAMLEGVIERGSTLWVPDAEVVIDRPSQDDQGRTTVSMGVDPLSVERAVSVVDPLKPGTRHPLSNFAIDYRGRRLLLHQARLSSAQANILESEFLAASGLWPAAVHAEGMDAKRVWLVVADLDGLPAEIRRSSGRFVHHCAVVRSIVAAARASGVNEPATPPQPPWFARVAPDEIGGTYIIGPRGSLEERVITRRHGLVSMTLRLQLGQRGIVMQKLQHPLGFEMDGEVLRPNAIPLLLEIKTSISAGDIHTGVGQLHLYSRLLPGLGRHKLVLLLPKRPATEVIEAIERTGIAVHSYTFADAGDGNDVVFSDAFMSLCGEGA